MCKHNSLLKTCSCFSCSPEENGKLPECSDLRQLQTHPASAGCSPMCTYVSLLAQSLLFYKPAVHRKKRYVACIMRSRCPSNHSPLCWKVCFSCIIFTFLFICRRWPTLLFCTLRTPRSSTSGTCSCSVHAASAAGCCGLCRSTDSHSCPCQGWSCCRCDPACPLSLTPGPARRNPATSRSTPARWCLAAADACGGGGGGGCSDDGGDGGCDGCGGCYGCCGVSGPAVQCSGCEPWWAWQCGSALWEWNPLVGTPAWPASKSSAGSCLTSRGTCISFSCGRAPPARDTQAKTTQAEWGSEQRQGTKGRGCKRWFLVSNNLLKFHVYFYTGHRAATFINSFNQATVILGKSRISIGPTLKTSGPLLSNIMISNNIL